MRALLAGLLTLAACSGADEAKQLVAADFRDPASLEWRNVTTGKNSVGQRTACGEVNGKNLDGAYVGFRRFFADLDAGTVVLEPVAGPDEASAKMARLAFDLYTVRCPS